jgi:multidrug resistance protein MdtO
MNTAAQAISAVPSSLSWLTEFLKQELALYPRRTALIARMVIAATLVMIICITFRIPYAFQGAIYTLIVSRDTSQATFKSAAAILSLTAFGALYLLVSAWFVISTPTFHLLWVIASFFLGFYGIGILNNFAASSTFAIMLCVGVPLLDRYVSAETNVEDILWLCLSSAIGVLVTVAVETSFAPIRPGGDILAGLTDRLAAMQDLLTCLAQDCPVDRLTETELSRLAVVGTSTLRRVIRRSPGSPHYAEQMGAVIALTGTLVDLAANLTRPAFQISEQQRTQIRRLAENVATIRLDLLAGKTPQMSKSPMPEGKALTATSFLPEMERTVALMNEVLAGSRLFGVAALRPSTGEPPPTFFVRDAFTNIEHIEFAVKGCLTAGLCYMIYNAVDWPGISTAVTTCFLTALTTVGSSRQKQVLRICGAVVGGFLLGMGAQIFVLPHIESIAGFTVLFIIVTALACWFVTSSARLSYFGIQVALAYYLIHLQSFAIESSLATARDRVVGVLFGLVMMWLVFDRLWSAPAIVQMKQQFISVLRLLAQFSREPVSAKLKIAIDRAYSLREQINTVFDNVRSSSDGVLFEFGPSREQGLAWRSRIKDWQPQLRALFLARIALWKYRTHFPGFDLPESILASQQEFDRQSAKLLDGIADRMEGRAAQEPVDLDQAFGHLEEAVRNVDQQSRETLEPQLQTFLLLSSRYTDLAASLNRQIRPVAVFSPN